MLNDEGVFTIKGSKQNMKRLAKLQRAWKWTKAKRGHPKDPLDKC
jgi:hypothetical protein